MKFSARVTALSVAFFAMFSILGLRLWFVQVAQGPAIAEAAEEQAWVEIRSFAPRGDIYDRNGTLLVTSRLVPAVVVDRTFVTSDQAESLIQELSTVLGIGADAIAEMYDKAGSNGRFPVTTVSSEVAYRINEMRASLPGVEVVTVPERVYLAGPTLAHVIGHLGLPEQSDIEDRPDIDPNVRIGKLGVERVYNEWLEGVPGLAEYRVQRGQIVDQRPPDDAVPGNSVVLNIDLETQDLVEMGLEEGVALSNRVKDGLRAEGEDVFGVTERAAAVVLDAKTFEVVALASYPDFDPQFFVTGIDTSTFAALQESRAFNNLAISGQYPPASTFKAITYTVAMEEDLPLPPDVEGVDPARRLVHCDGTLFLDAEQDVGSGNKKTDWYFPADKGWLDLHDALEQSCNIYFWSLALGTWRAYQGGERENIIQEWTRDLGYGAETGVDLTAEAPGIVPTRELFEEWKEFQLENPDLPPRLEPARLELGSPWLGGDLLDLAIGQGAFVATPLQVAVSYAALANGGTVMEPRVVARVVDPAGNTVYEPEARVVRQIPIDAATRLALLTDLNRVVTTGTARAAFDTFGPGLNEIGGKTGTGQTSPTRDNHAWFVGVAPISDPQYVVVVVIDEGGSGGQVAAPVGRAILQHLMGNEITPIVRGEVADG